MTNRELILRLVVVTLLLYSLTAFSSSAVKLQRSKIAVIEIENELIPLKEKNSLLKSYSSQDPDDEKMRELAREKLGMINPEDKIFVFPKTERSCYGAGNR